MGKIFCLLTYLSKSLPVNNSNEDKLYNLIKDMMVKDGKYRPDSFSVYKQLKQIYYEKYFKSDKVFAILKPLSYLFYNLKAKSQEIDKLNNESLASNLFNFTDTIKYSETDIDLMDLSENINKEAFKENMNMNLTYIFDFIIKRLISDLNLNRVEEETYHDYQNPDSIQKNKAIEKYKEFRQKIQKSLLSDNLFITIKKKRRCKHCNAQSYAFNSIPYVKLNLDLMKKDEYKRLNLYDAFDYFNKNNYNEYETLEKICDLCDDKDTVKIVEFQQLYSMSNNLIISINREGKEGEIGNFINFDEKLKLKSYVEEFNILGKEIIYDLYAIVTRIEVMDSTGKRVKKYLCFTKRNFILKPAKRLRFPPRGLW